MSEKQLTISRLVSDDGFRKQAEKTLGERTPQFMSSVLSLVNANQTLQRADPIKVYNACLMSAALNLPVNNNLGYAYIIPYKDDVQLQIGWKGFVQLAQRSGQFKTIVANPVHENELTGINPMTGEVEFEFKTEKEGDVVGYMAYFKLLNGFEKSLYMSVKELNNHAKKYSQTFKKGFGVWNDNFDAMAIKTVVKLLLNKYAPLSIDMQKAIEIDQKVDDEYKDNKPSFEVEGAELGDNENEEK
jgi:recombination protein RecT